MLTGEHHVPLFRNTEVLTNLPRGRPQSSFKALAPQLEKVSLVYCRMECSYSHQSSR